ncbi:ABC transporter substrate-binding protein [Pullulanibacillus sp. KACC 23026]|uniref:ABC transporter substrate-binding protein n=1 Tax=Pullulanibacillus sp. KACC 23026 TaxID=3028315 RepID=UPI0023AF2A94|nr:ABC transporter substrate-binding protein [Pullulanibacillus sp. KACC 23026]WEG13958.1 ABC transporter substrate-binding protein [Pullulanibacillus sp. KACC 23026]
MKVKMKLKHRLTLFLVIVFAMSVCLAGCGSKTSSSTPSNGPGSDGSSSKTVAQPLTVGAPNGNWQDNFNPFSASAVYGTIGLIYQPLYVFSTISHDEYPMLATKYEWINDNKTLEVTLRTGVKWSDGQPFTADDVLFTFNDELKKYPAADTSGIMKVVKSVVKKSDNVVDFNFDQPNVPFQEYVLQAAIVPEHIWKSLGDPSKVNMTKPVGTGPYVLSNFTPQNYTMKKNTSFYDASNYAVPEINFKAYDSNESAQLALASGQLDWAGMFIPNVDKVYTAKSKDYHYWFPPASPIILYPNLKNPLLKDVNVRKAISLAIDRDKIVKQAEYGYANVSSPTGVQIPRDKDFIDPKYADLQYKQDTAGAEKILQDAGYKKGSDGIYVSPSGKKLSFTLQVVSGWSDWITTCMLISQDLKKIGIDVKVQQPQYGAYQSNLQGGKFDLALSWTNPGATPYKTFKDMLSTSGGWNIEGWNDPTTEQALDQFKGTTDPAVQKAAMSKIEDVMVNQLPVLPIFYGETWYEYTTTHYTGWPDNDHQYDTPTVFNWPQAVVVIQHLKPVSK